MLVWRERYSTPWAIPEFFQAGLRNAPGTAPDAAPAPPRWQVLDGASRWRSNEPTTRPRSKTASRARCFSPSSLSSNIFGDSSTPHGFFAVHHFLSNLGWFHHGVHLEPGKGSQLLALLVGQGPAVISDLDLLGDYVMHIPLFHRG